MKSQSRFGRNRYCNHEFVARGAKAISNQNVGIMVKAASGPRRSAAALESQTAVGQAWSCQDPYGKRGAPPCRYVNRRHGGIQDDTNVICGYSYSCPGKLHNVRTAWRIVDDGKLYGSFSRALRKEEHAR